MKKMILMAALVLPFFVYGQTEQAEKDYMNSQLTSMSQSEMINMGAAWRDLLKEFGGYPTLPYNEETKKVEFIDVLSFPGKTKKQLMNLTKEWIAIRYGNINAVLHYEDEATGKIIAKGFQYLPYEAYEWKYWGKIQQETQIAKCYHTVIFTIKDEKLKIEHTDLEYKIKTRSYMSGTTYIPSSIEEIPLYGLYPVTREAENTWKSRLRTLQYATLSVEESVLDFRIYINGADAYNGF